MSWKLVVPSLFTMAAMLAGFFSILASAQGEFVLAAQLILISMLLDGLDGTLARLLKASTQFGAELDTYVDMTSFGLAPAALLYHMVLKDAGLLGLVMTCGIVLSGVSRLSRFRVIDPHRGQRGYIGLPITNAAGSIAAFVIATQYGELQNLWLSLQHGPLAALFWTSTAVYLVLQVSHIRYPKPTKNPRIFIPFSATVVCLFLAPAIAVPAAFVLIGYGFYYAFVSPFLYRRHALAVPNIADAADDEEEEPVSVRHS